MLAEFHPLTAGWFQERFGEPTEPQRLGWPAIASGSNTLIAAPTGSGKTLAAFLICLDRLVRQGIEGRLPNELQVLYISPLKALSNDVQRNLDVPLAEITERAWRHGALLPPLRVLVRTGDTPQRDRQAMLRRPPHILVTTPESLYLLLTSPRARQMLRTVRTVIVDEIHALARDKRGSHLSLSLERLDALCPTAPVRIGLSATQRPIDAIARFLVGSKNVDSGNQPNCRTIDTGHVREMDLAIEVPPSELSAVCSQEIWGEVYERLAELIRQHRSTLVFVNTRRLAERLAHHLRQHLGDDAVASHHGSLSREIRHSAELRLKAGTLKAVVATASLELGIDIGFVDLVCQIGSPRAIATFLQRVGRSGHSLGVTPKGRLFPLSRAELLECMALVRAVRAGRLDCIDIPEAPLDILAQQIVAEVACRPWSEQDLYDLFRRTWPYRNLSRRDFDAVIHILSEGFVPGRTRRGAYLHRDRIHGRLRPRRGARIAAVTSGGAIPETFDYRVVTYEEGTYVGSVNEDFAVETMAGDVFLLGNTSWRVQYVRGGQVVVQDAQGQPATIPFWLGEAPARTMELSAEVSKLCEEMAQRVEPHGDGTERSDIPAAHDDHQQVDSIAWLQEHCGVDHWGAEQALNYVASQKAAIGLVPTQEQVVFERFFDDSGGMQLVIHSPFGARINRAWGLALRKRFCRSFNFELQASADDNGIVLSLGPQHSFALEQMFRLVRRETASDVLIQALLAVPFFTVRWRWNCNRALAVPRQRGGKHVPPPLQRMQADDLLSAVFPAQTACQENVGGDIPIPDHPLVAQTIRDCLHEAMDLDGWLDLLRRIEQQEVRLIGVDTREPSPFSYELLNANPYAFLDDAPLEERRARAVATRRFLTPEMVRDLGQLDPEVVRSVSQEAWPLVRDAEELHDALLTLVALPEQEAEPGWHGWFEQLVETGRATVVSFQPGSASHPDSGRGGPPSDEKEAAQRPALWVAAENWPLLQVASPHARAEPVPTLPPELSARPTAADAWVALVRGRLQCSGPTTAGAIAHALQLPLQHVRAALEALEGEGFALQGRWLPTAHPASCESRSPTPQLTERRATTSPPDGAAPIQWCERRILARIHRRTLEGLRRQIQPVSPADYFRFLARHTHLHPDSRLEGAEGLWDLIGQLAGFEVPAGAWEQEVLLLRLPDYDPKWLDDLAVRGRVAWGRLLPARSISINENHQEGAPSGTVAPRRTTGTGMLTRAIPLSLFPRADLNWLLPTKRPPCQELTSSSARTVLELLQERGALFFEDLVASSGLLPGQVEAAMSELAALGLASADSFAAIRRLVSPESQRRLARRRRRAAQTTELAAADRQWPSASPAWTSGRWALFPYPNGAVSLEERRQRWAWLLLHRYGVVFRDLLARETLAPSWGELVRIYRPMEARGEIRGGRFVLGVGGEQYTLEEAVTRLRELRDQGPRDEWIIISAADPLNLVGIVLPGQRIPATRTNTLAVRDGRLVAARIGRQIHFYQEVEPALADQLHRALRRSGLARLRDPILSQTVSR